MIGNLIFTQVDDDYQLGVYYSRDIKLLKI